MRGRSERGRPLGARLGLTAGTLMHRTTVCPEENKRTLIQLMITRDAVGVRVTRRW